MSWLDEIYQVVRAAYLDREGEERMPSASSLPPSLPPIATHTPEMAPIPSDSFMGEWLRGPEDPYRGLALGSIQSTGQKLGRASKALLLDYPVSLVKEEATQIDRFWNDPTMTLPEVTMLAANAIGAGAPGGGTGPANMMRWQFKRDLAREVAPLKQGKTKLMRHAQAEADRAANLAQGLREMGRTGEAVDIYEGVAKSEQERASSLARQIQEMVTGMRETGRAMDRIPQTTFDDIQTVGPSVSPFSSQATREHIGISPFHVGKDLPKVAGHEVTHSGQRSMKIVPEDMALSDEGIEMFKRLREADVKTRVIDDYLSASPEFTDLVSSGYAPGAGYKMNPMEHHANVLGELVASGQITKEQYPRAFMAAMEKSLALDEGNVNELFRIMSDRDPTMHRTLAAMRESMFDDYSYMINHPDPEVGRAIKAISRQAKQGEGLFGKMVYLRGQEKNVETRISPEGELQYRQYGEIWRSGAPTQLETNPRSNRIGEPVGISVTGNPDIAFDFRDRMAPRPNRIPSMKTPAIRAMLEVYDKKIAKAGPEELPKLQKARKFYAEEYARRTDPRSIERVRLNLEGDPDKVLVKTFDEKGQKALLETYEETMLEELTKIFKAKKSLARDAFELISQRNTKYELYDAVERTLKLNVAGAENFNLKQTAKLQERGYKGIAYSPSRYDEFEVKMFEPEDVYALDVRKWSKTDPSVSDPGLKRLMNESQQERLDVWDAMAKSAEEEYGWDTSSLGKLYKQVDLRDIIYRAVRAAYAKET